MKKYLVYVLVVALLVISILTACTAEAPNAAAETNLQADTAQAEATQEDAEMPLAAADVVQEAEVVPFILEYPVDMQAMGFTEALVLDTVPSRVAVMSVGPVMTLYELGVGIVAVPTTTLIEYPESLDVPLLPSAMADDFDLELVVSLEPDLVIMGFTNADTHGASLEALGIPVYYVMAGHVVPYESIRSQTTALIQAFTNEENVQVGQALEVRFEDLEETIAQVHERISEKNLSVMVLQGDTHMQTSMAFLGSMLYMLGFTNVSQMPGALIMIDFEQALYYDPDWIFAVGPAPSVQEQQALLEESFAVNQAYWDSIPAFYEDRMVYLPVAFISSAGIAVVDLFHELIEIVDGILEE